MAEARVPGVLAALTAAIDGLLEVDAVVLAEGDTVLGLLAQVSRLELGGGASGGGVGGVAGVA
jgi:hypothetical protein